MADRIDEERARARRYRGSAGVDEAERARLCTALEAERYLPFCNELALHFVLREWTTRALLARLADRGVWTKGEAPVHSFVDFEPGEALAPLRAGFVRLRGGARIPRHRHHDREFTMVLEGVLVDDEGRSYRPGDVIEMAIGSARALAVSEDQEAVVALLHGRIEALAG